jgi:phosphonate transport system ATP-binding protein
MLDPSRVNGASVNGQAAINIRGLTKLYAGRAVFEKLDLDIGTGQAVAVIGSNGTGKSTLLRCLIGLTEPDGGTVQVLGQMVTGINRRTLTRIRSQVGFVFQKHNLVTRLSVLSNVVHGAQAQGPGPRNWLQCLATSDTRRRALECLARVGLADRALQKAGSLSGGQSQRVAVARMLMQSPRLILADEPDASLDPQSGAEVMSLLRGICRDMGTTLIFVSHHMEHATGFADRIVGLSGGRVSLDKQSADCDPARLRSFFSDATAEVGVLDQVA